MNGRWIETAVDAHGAEIRRGDFVRKYSGTDTLSYKVTMLYVTPENEQKAKIRTIDGTGNIRKAVVLARKLRRLNGPAGKLAEMADAQRIAELGRRAEAGNMAQVVCENTTVIAARRVAEVAQTLDRVAPARYSVELWYGERVLHHAVVDSVTKEVVEQFTDRDLAYDTAREMNLR